MQPNTERNGRKYIYGVGGEDTNWRQVKGIKHYALRQDTDTGKTKILYYSYYMHY